MSSDIAVANVMSRGLCSEWRSFLQACDNEHLIISGSMVGGVCLTWIQPTISAVRSSGRILVQLTVYFNPLVWKRPRPGLVVTRSFSNFWMRPTNSFNVMLNGLRAESWVRKEWNGRSGSNGTMSNQSMEQSVVKASAVHALQQLVPLGTLWKPILSHTTPSLTVSAHMMAPLGLLSRAVSNGSSQGDLSSKSCRQRGHRLCKSSVHFLNPSWWWWLLLLFCRALW